MKTILEIRHYKYLLPENANAVKMLRWLSESVPITTEYVKDKYVYYTEGEIENLELKMVKDSDVIERPAASPDCHGPALIGPAPINDDF